MKFKKSQNKRLNHVVIIGLLMLTACTPAVKKADFSQEKPVLATGGKTATVDTIKQHFGIEVVALHLAAAGHMLDFRFRVVDLDKAMPFFREDIKPYALDQKSGKSLSVPVPAKLGPMRPTGRDPKEGITYWMFFGNPGLIGSGDKVTIVIGDYHLENLIVE